MEPSPADVNTLQGSSEHKNQDVDTPVDADAEFDDNVLESPNDNDADIDMERPTSDEAEVFQSSASPNNQDAPTPIDDAPTDDAPTDDALDDNAYAAMIARKEAEEDEFVQEVIDQEDEEEAVRVDRGCVLLDATFSEERMAEMRSMYVKDDDGNDVHKKTVLKRLNQGKSLSKSFDREKRVRGDAKKGAGRSNQEGVAHRAFRYAHDASGDPESGTKTHNADDYCCLLVETLLDSSSQNKKVKHMVVGVYKRFGPTTTNSPADLCWPIDKPHYRACIEVVATQSYHDINSDMGLKCTGKILATFRNVHSSTITPIKPSLEESETDIEGQLVTVACMKITDLSTIFSELTNRSMSHTFKSETVLPPTMIDHETPFVVVRRTSTAAARYFTCSQCTPPKNIANTNQTLTDIQRLLRNHAASHQWQQPFDGHDICGFCCGITAECRLEVGITNSNKRNILEKQASVAPSALVHVKCIKFPEVDPFQFKFCKAVRGYPSTNVPVLCNECTGQVFIWSYNLDKHQLLFHPGLTDEEKSKYNKYQSTMEECALIERAFPINVDTT
eukprot:scaffold92009_cov60-Cyclotella_meneghiniana.AAC.5